MTGERPSLVVVDDEPGMLSFLVKTLAPRCHFVMNASSAEEGAQFVHLLGFVQFIQQAEAGVTGVGGHLAFQLRVAVVEKLLHEPDGLGMREGELIDPHRFLIEVAGVKKFDAEGKSVGGPEGPVPAEADFAILVVIELVLLEHVGQVRLGGAERFAGAFLGLLGDILQGDFGGGGGGLSASGATMNVVASGTLWLKGGTVELNPSSGGASSIASSIPFRGTTRVG